ncbi:glycosyltransferase family 2 protein [Elizabethkingia sp. JS20170427COW]|uniref:glycosyltransferase family 2 protein n=1 Tax=Elizabethkingia sp. JS20170427COW TaxID=2583851 RepID=UPI001110575F|nr:glycosyltransferase [Elizabethkingia sp. JS20170427COW]QCX53423.1 glycosyltransferase family 2 protein [Elizabethkingia sp. JS20170427COW]
MPDILIKSFNRPFYLDRCLQSIDAFVKGDFRVIVLDDGTPKKYLDKIQEKYPDVEIRRSEQYEEKTKAIEENLKLGKEINGFKIPTQLWKTAVQQAGDYVLVTEDDVWFNQEINLEEVTKQMRVSDIYLTKLGWLGNASRDTGYQSISNLLETISAKQLFTSNEWVMDWFFYNKFKVFSLLYKLGKVDNYTVGKYWQLNSILMGLWKKDYWLHVWKDAQGKVDEKEQLRNAAAFYHCHKTNPNFVAKTKTEILKTTFQSSATGSYHQYGVDFNVNYFNHLINEAWLKGEFDPMQNFPKDFSLDYFDRFLDDKMDQNNFRLWVEHFKSQYRNQGADVG